jgi:hypothetical protein
MACCSTLSLHMTMKTLAPLRMYMKLIAESFQLTVHTSKVILEQAGNNLSWN